MSYASRRKKSLSSNVEQIENELEVISRDLDHSVELLATSKIYSEATISCKITGAGITVLPTDVIVHHLSSSSEETIAVICATSSDFKYSYSYTWHPGLRGGSHESETVYQLPFLPRHSQRVSNSFGSGLHTEEHGAYFAIDFEMQPGSIVCAAREGLVVGCKQTSSAGGPKSRFLNHANFVLIKHEDGSYAEYFHLRKNSLLVSNGEIIRAGQPIGRSGNTGYSSYPHLHFNVFIVDTAGKRISCMTKLRTLSGVIENPDVNTFLEC